jgi:hypothetical protein
MTDLGELRAGLRELYEKHDRGDIPRKEFERQAVARTLDLARAVVRGRLPPDEAVLAEHHLVHSHLQLTRPVLGEPDTEAVSLFATDRRLVRLSSWLAPGQQPTMDHLDRTRLDELPYRQIDALDLRRQIRPGEIAAGLIIVAFAFVFRSWLQVTGTLMVLLGVLGVAHGLLLPTSWAAITPVGETEPWRVDGPRKKSARRLLQAVRERRSTIAPRAGGRSNHV